MTRWRPRASSVVESDLGEFIQQLKHEPPYHFVFPCMHLRGDEISALFEKELGSAPTDSPEELTMIARRWLRQKYLKADIGITGANFIIAETGMISITENEGNARLTAAHPKMHDRAGGDRESAAAPGGSRAVSADARHGRHRAEHDVLQLDVRRPAPAGRNRRPGGVSRRPAR